MIVKLRMSGGQHSVLRKHLFPSDGLEAVALALCGRRAGEHVHALSVRKLHFVPYDGCAVRRHNRVTWPVEQVRPLLQEAADRDWAVVKFHSHPAGPAGFSKLDDLADRELLTAAQVWTNSALPHGSVVMLADGTMRGRWMTAREHLEPISVIGVAGDDLQFWFAGDGDVAETPEYARRNAQAFGVGTTTRLNRLSAAVIGCSGTGSSVIELLARHGIGRLVLVDPDRVEEKNLNRIIHATSSTVLDLSFVYVQWR